MTTDISVLVAGGRFPQVWSYLGSEE